MKKLFILTILTLLGIIYLKTLAQNLPTGLPSDISGYKKWTRLNKKVIGPRDADPHFGFKREYVNRLKSEIADLNMNLIFPFPEGTIIVKEVRKTIKPKSKITLISIMRKQAGNETTGSWDFIEYTRSSSDNSFIPINFPKESCYSCHMGAADSDSVWTTFDNF
ncbi:MAG: cytochrome P460 family protein [Candidatus Melainabacteria bacterium]|nr:cytochrome P460 family protein [Candidatus Melainabacteria bacterium]